MGDFFRNTLNPWQWAVLLAVPPAILALYFLRLVREPIQVPSTFLWRQTIEDLHVNALWQTIRNNLLLILQLLLVALLILAVLAPGLAGQEIVGERLIFLLDTSASMSGNDVDGGRLAAAKAEIRALIEGMDSGDAAMLISFSDRAKVEQGFTSSRALLRSKLEAVTATTRRSDASEALRAASGLANSSGVVAGDEGEETRPEQFPAQLYIFSDGQFGPIENFTLGKLTPEFRPIGSDRPRNVGIVQFTVARLPDKPGQMQVFAQIENSSSTATLDAATGEPDPTPPESVEAALYLDGKLLDASTTEVAAGESAGLQFTLDDIEQGSLRLELELANGPDHLRADDIAYAVVNSPQKSRVLLVSPQEPATRNEALEWALETAEIQRIAEVTRLGPEFLTTKTWSREAELGTYDLVVFEQCGPQTLPRSNTLFFGQLPPDGRWKFSETYAAPGIIDTARSHPLMQYIELGDVLVAESPTVDSPAGGIDLIEADVGPLAAVAPRDGFQDLVVAFEIYSQGERDGQPARMANTNWPIRLSWPFFLKNVVAQLGSARAGAASANLAPGETFRLRLEGNVDELEVRTPGGQRLTTRRSSNQAAFLLNDTEELGVYAVFVPGEEDPVRRFSVNLFSSRESQLRPAEELDLGEGQKVGATASVWQPTRFEFWKFLVAAGLLVLLIEWAIYTRRVAL